MELSTTYLGLPLRSPLVASPGPSTARIEGLVALEQAGIGAVVLPSLFEEQAVHEELSSAALFQLGDDSNPEATGYFPDLTGYETVTDRYLRHVEEAKAALDVPVIASLNGTSAGGWTRYAQLLEDAGADAVELNLYTVAGDPGVAGAELELEQFELVTAVRRQLTIPLAVKVGPYYSAFANFARGLVAAGADALVLFNRFYQPDLSPETREVVASLDLSTPAELRLPLRWIALLHGRLDVSFAATTGIHSGLDAAKVLLAGAEVAMTTSALLRNGIDHVRVIEAELVAWGDEQGFASVDQLRGSASQRHVPDPAAFERANYIGTLVSYTNSFSSAQGEGPW